MLLESKINVPEHVYGIEFKDVSIDIEDVKTELPSGGYPISAEEFWRGCSMAILMINGEMLGKEFLINRSNVATQHSKSDSHIINELEKVKQ